MKTWTILMAGIASAVPNATIPNDCSSGSLLVSQGNGVFACVSPSRALALSGCQANDFITTDGTDLRCTRPQSMSWSIKGLLPDCSSGHVLVSEGFGSWRCVSQSSLSVLPSCSSGQTIVADGSSWRCADRK